MKKYFFGKKSRSIFFSELRILWGIVSMQKIVLFRFMRFSEWSRHSFMGFGSCFPKNPLKKRHITIFLFWGWAPLPPPNLNFVKMWGFRERSKWIMLQGESSDWVRSFCIVSIMYRGYRKKLLEPLEHVLNMFTRSALTFVTDFAEMVYAPNFRAWVQIMR